MRLMTPLEAEIASHVRKDWRTFKDILFEYNGPKELTMPGNNVKAILDRLVKQKLLERKSMPKLARSGLDNFYANDQSAYRLRAS